MGYVLGILSLTIISLITGIVIGIVLSTEKELTDNDENDLR